MTTTGDSPNPGRRRPASVAVSGTGERLVDASGVPAGVRVGVRVGVRPDARARNPAGVRAGVPAGVRAGEFIALVCSATVFGLTLAHVLQSPGSRGLSGADWLAVQHTFYGGFAVVGGVTEVVGLVSAAAVAWILARHSGVRRAVVPAIAALCFLGTLLSYWLGNRSVNSKIAQWTSATLPPDWESYRSTWENAHAVTAGLAAIAFFTLAVALIWRPAAGARDAG